MWAVCSLHTGRPWVSVSTHRTSVGVRQHTQDDTFSTLVLGLSTLNLPVDCSGDFGPRGLSVQYTHDVRGYPPAHTGRLWLSVCVRQHTHDARGCPSVHISARWSLDSARWPFPWTVRVILAQVGCLVSTHMTSVGVRQHTHDVCGCPSAHTGHPWLSVCVRVCPSAHTRRPWLSISTHISTLVLGLSTLTLPVDCTGDFGPRGLSVQYSHDVCGCPPAHTGRQWLSVCDRVCPCVSVSTHMTSVYTQDVRGCLSAHTGRLWVSVSTHRTSVAVCVCPCVSVSTHRTSVAVHHTHRTSVGVRQHTHDVCGCPCVTVCVRVSLSAHTGRPWLSISTYISTQYTQDVRGCPSAHRGRLWVSISTHRMSVAVCVCPCVSVSTYRTSVAVHQYTYQHVVHTGRLWVSASTHRTSVAVRVCPLSVQYTQDVRGCPPAHTGHPWLSVCVCVCPSAHTGHLWLSINTHISTLVFGLSMLALPVDCSDDFGPRRLSVQYTQDVCGCPLTHTARPCVSVSTHRMSAAARVCLSAHTGRLWLTHRTSVGVRQHTHDVRGCPSAHTGRPWLTGCVRVCPSAHTGRPWLSISTHISTLVLRLSTLTLPVDCTGDFGPRGLSVQYSHDIRGCPPALTGRPWLSVCDRVCPCVSVSTHKTSVVVHQYTYQHAVHTGRPWVSVSTHRTSVGVRQHTQDVRGCMFVSVCFHQHTPDVRGCSSVHISARCTHRTSVDVRQHTQDVCGCPCVSVCATVCVRQHTQDICSCPSINISARWPFPWTVRVILAHVGCLFSTHRTSVGVRQHTQDVRGYPCVSVCVCVCPSAHTGHLWLSINTNISTLVLGLSMLALPVDCSDDFGPRRLSVQYTQDVCGCPLTHTGRPCVSVSTDRTSVAVRVCPSVHTGRLWLSISAHISTLVLGLSTLTFLVDRSGDFGTRGLSVQYTQNVRGCPLAHTGRPWLFVCVRVCPSAHTGRPWLSISTHISSLDIGLSTLALPVDCSGYFGPRGLSVQYTQDVRGTHRPSVGVRQHTQDVCGCPCVSVCVLVCPSAHTGHPWLSITTHVSMLVLGLSMLTLPVDCSGDFGPRGLSVQYTQDVRGCPSAHTGRPWVSFSTHRTSVGVRQHTQDVSGCPCVSVCTHMTSVAVHQYTYQHYTQDVRGCLPAHTGRPCVSVSTYKTSVAVHQYTYQHAGPWTQHAGPFRGLFGTLVLGLSMLTLPVDCSGDFGPRRLSVQYTQDVCGTHISTLVLGLSTLALPVDCSGDFGPRGLSVQYTQDVRGCPSAHTGRPWVSFSTHRTSVDVRQHTQDVSGCPCVSVCTHMTSMAVHQYTYQHVGLWTQHADPSRGLFGTSVAVRVCPSAHTRRPWLSISTHISTLVLRPSTLALPVDCSGDFGPRGLSVQYTEDVCGYPPAHTGRLWLSVCVRQHTHDVRCCPSVHISARWSLDSACWPFPWTVRVILAQMGCLFSTHRTSVGVRQHTQDARGCPSAHTGRPWLSVCVYVCPSAHTRRLRLSISTHISTLVLGLSTLTLPVDCTGDFGPRGLFVQYSYDVRGCLPAHTGRPWLSVCDLVCLSAHTGRPWLSISTHISTQVLGLSTLALPMDCSSDFGPCGLSIQYTQDVRGCPSAHTGRLWVSVSTHRTSVGVRQHTQDVRGCLCVSVCFRQHTQDVRGCPSVHISVRCTHRTSVGVRQHTQDARGCPSAHTGHPWLSVCVCVCPSAHTRRPWLSISTNISTLVLGLSTLTLPVDCTGTLTLPVDCTGDFGQRGLSVQYSHDVRGCPPAHTGRPTHISTQVLGLSTLALPMDCSSDFGPCGLSIQYTQDVRGCPSAHTGRLWVSVSTHRTSVALCVCPCVSVSTHRTSVAVHQYTYQYVGPWTQHADPSRGLFG
ncbi:hypothetical protein YC2023_066052 [Brassica napus]